jgi:hypothetical protein
MAATGAQAAPGDEDARLAVGLELVRRLRAGSKVAIKKEFWAQEAN